MCPTSASAKFSSRRVMPAWFMITPAKMKKGTASSGKESVAWANFCT